MFYDFDDIYNGDCSALVAEAVAFSERTGASGNAWANYLAYRLITSENAFSLAAERNEANGTLSRLVREDIARILPLFAPDYARLDMTSLAILLDYHAGSKSTRFAERVVLLAERLCAIAARGMTDSAYSECTTALVRDYSKRGAGKLAECSAFRLVTDSHGYALAPVPNFCPKPFDSLVGIEDNKRALIENTRAFLGGEDCNNVLLYGDAGTGKSTCIKALLPHFDDGRLRIIEIYKHQYSAIARLMSELGNRGLKFIFFLDDLSFEESETEYKYFKAILEGGLGGKPNNVVVYATSNRVHLIKETFSERGDMTNDDIHRSDTVEEKISLSARFGLALLFAAPDTREYLDIVRSLAVKNGIDMPVSALENLAMRWVSAQNKKSGRTAEQFIRSLKIGITE